MCLFLVSEREGEIKAKNIHYRSICCMSAWQGSLTEMILVKDIQIGGRSQDGGGIGWGDHFLSYKFMERTIERWANFTKQLLIASRGHQVPRQATHCLRKESSNTPLLFLNFHFHFTITLQKKKKKEREREALFLNWTSYIFLNFSCVFVFVFKNCISKSLTSTLDF